MQGTTAGTAECKGTVTLEPMDVGIAERYRATATCTLGSVALLIVRMTEESAMDDAHDLMEMQCRDCPNRPNVLEQEVALNRPIKTSEQSDSKNTPERILSRALEATKRWVNRND